MNEKLSNGGCMAGWLAFAAGFLAVWPALLAGYGLQELFSLPKEAPEAVLLYAALPEEAIKLAVAAVLLLFGGTPALVGLGFGLSETVFMVSTISSSPWPLRLLSSVPLHAGATALACSWLQQAARGRRFGGGVLRKAVPAAGLPLLAIALHWAYNLAARQESWTHWGLAWTALLLWLVLRKLMRG